MEQLNKESTDYLIKLINTLQASKIEVGVIGDWGVGAMTEGSVYAMIAQTPEFPGTLALTRISTLKARLDLVKNKPGFGINYDLSDTDEIRSLELRAGDTTVGYRCGMAESAQVPKRVFADTLVSFTIDSALVNEVARAVNAFNKDGNLTFESIDGKVIVSVADENGDKYRNVVGVVDGEIPLHSYSASVITDLMNLADKDGGGGNVTVGVGDKGIMSIVSGGLECSDTA